MARKRALGIPVHEDDADHDDRGDGYCNCGQRLYRPWRTPRPARATVGKVHLDIIERNANNR